MRKAIIFFIALISVGVVKAQDTCTIYGTVSDLSGKVLPDVLIQSGSIQTLSNQFGKYELNIPVQPKIEIFFKDASTKLIVKQRTLYDLKKSEKYLLDISMKSDFVAIDPYVVHDDKARSGFITPVDPKLYQNTINPSMNFESMLRMLGPIAMNNELSSQYNVRGGNFDENLVYVNDIEIYRPQLVRSGQQEGLSFINPDMVQNVKFSAGGYEAKYGDKMSSVLDIQYKKLQIQDTTPTYTVNANLLGGMFSTQRLSKNHRFSYLIGARYRSNSYLLNSLDVQGNYKPRFADIQGFFNYQLRSNQSLSLLVSHADNKYLFYPQSQTTSFGTVNSALQLFIGFEGSQLTRTLTDLAAITYKVDLSNKLQLRFIGTTYQSNESESFDVIGGYELRDLDNDLGSTNFGKVKQVRGIGAFMNHARNSLQINVTSASHKGQYITKKQKVLWGFTVQQEKIKDQMREWSLEDSAGFLTPWVPGEDLHLKTFFTAKNNLISNRVNGFVQNENKLSKKIDLVVNYGVRSQYWTVNQQTTISPRFNVSFKPFKRYNQRIDFLRNIYKDSTIKRMPDWLFRFAAGVYHQPPFYRELRRFDGTLNTNLNAQRSKHIIIGSDLNFKAWNRPFKFVMEAYYKKYNSLVPYDIDNVKIRYYAQNLSKGYATGLDFRVNGEFIESLESWVSLSLMKTSERINGFEHWRYYDDKGYIYLDNNKQVNIVDSQYITYFPRPTDQRFNFNIFFQDHLPKNPRYRMSMNLVYAAGLPTSPPFAKELRNAFRVPPYRRVDIGFSKVLVDENKRIHKGIGKGIKNMWLSLEIFNLLQFNNTVSYLWVEDLTNRQYAVPNYLTSRRINLHLVVKI